MRRNVRAAPANPLLQPLPCEGQIDWNAAAPLTLTVLPAGHEPGLYEIIQTFIPVVGATSGTLTTTTGWDQPRFGATTLVLNLGNLTAGSAPGALRLIDSSGVSPITVLCTPVSIVGSPSIAVACTARLVAFPVEV